MADRSDIIFNISGGNNQILPNATQATQNFYGDKYMEELAKKNKNQTDEGTDLTKSQLSLYINNVEKLSYYVGKLSTCDDARALAQVVMEMYEDDDVKVDNIEMVKERFIKTLLPFAPKVQTTTVISVSASMTNMTDRRNSATNENTFISSRRYLHRPNNILSSAH